MKNTIADLVWLFLVWTFGLPIVAAALLGMFWVWQQVFFWLVARFQ